MHLDWKQGITWGLAFGCGGLGGAFFNQWYANRSTVIEYTVNKTVLGTDQTTVVPNFRVQVGDTTLKTLYIYTLKLQYRSGPELENVKVGIGLLTPGVKLVGNTIADKPSEALDFTCAPFDARPKSSGTTCTLRRLNSNVGAYTVSFATNEEARIDVSIDAKNTQIKQAELPGGADHPLTMAEVLSLLFGLMMVPGFIWLISLERRRLNSPTINPRYSDDMDKLDKTFKLETIMNHETICIVAGDHIVSELLDRQTCGLLRDSINQKSRGRSFRRAVIVSAQTWRNSQAAAAKCPAISIGGETPNSISKEWIDAAKQKGVTPVPLGAGSGVYLSGPPPKAVLYGRSAADTKSAVEEYIISAPRGLAEFLTNCWKP